MNIGDTATVYIPSTGRYDKEATVTVTITRVGRRWLTVDSDDYRAHGRRFDLTSEGPAGSLKAESGTHHHGSPVLFKDAAALTAWREWVDAVDAAHQTLADAGISFAFSGGRWSETEVLALADAVRQIRPAAQT